MINIPEIDEMMYKHLKNQSKSYLAKEIIRLNNRIQELETLNSRLWHAMTIVHPIVNQGVKTDV